MPISQIKKRESLDTLVKVLPILKAVDNNIRESNQIGKQYNLNSKTLDQYISNPEFMKKILNNTVSATKYLMDHKNMPHYDPKLEQKRNEAYMGLAIMALYAKKNMTQPHHYK